MATPFTRTVAVHVPPWPSRRVVGPTIVTCMLGEGVTTDGVGVDVGVDEPHAGVLQFSDGR